MIRPPATTPQPPLSIRIRATSLTQVPPESLYLVVSFDVVDAGKTLVHSGECALPLPPASDPMAQVTLDTVLAQLRAVVRQRVARQLLAVQLERLGEVALDG